MEDVFLLLISIIILGMSISGKSGSCTVIRIVVHPSHAQPSANGCTAMRRHASAERAVLLLCTVLGLCREIDAPAIQPSDWPSLRN